MDKIYTIKLVFGPFLSIGAFILFMIAFKGYYKYLIQEKRCIQKTKGKVIKYTICAYGGSGIDVFLPIVAYTVNDKEYKIKGPEYRYYKLVTKTSPLIKNNDAFYEKDNVLYINRSINSFGGYYKNPLERLYPINTILDVYYDPNNPKLAYVKRYCNRKGAFYITFTGALFVSIALVYVLFIL